MKHYGDITKMSGYDIEPVDVITGGFPLVFERSGAKAVWASEIEDFCVAVTKQRFADDDRRRG